MFTLVYKLMNLTIIKPCIQFLPTVTSSTVEVHGRPKIAFYGTIFFFLPACRKQIIEFYCILGTGINPLYTGRLFHYYMFDESICHYRGVGSILSLLFYFEGKSC